MKCPPKVLCLTFLGGTSIFYSRGNKFKKLLLSLYLLHKRKPANPTLILSPLGYNWGQSAYLRSFKPFKKHKNPLISYEING